VKPERVSGIAQSSTVALEGAVVLRVKMLKAGSESEGVDILMRFKSMAGGQSKWVGIIFGAMSLDCTERRGLGFIP
jgi:hypothetical protein